jgi:hypothetical protein
MYVQIPLEQPFASKSFEMAESENQEIFSEKLLRKPGKDKTKRISRLVGSFKHGSKSERNSNTKHHLPVVLPEHPTGRPDTSFKPPPHSNGDYFILFHAGQRHGQVSSSGRED